MTEPELVYTGGAELAEGPVWWQGALWWVDIVKGTLNRLDPARSLNVSRGTGPFLGFAVPASDGRWLLGKRTECVYLDWETGQTETAYSTPPGFHPRHRYNDGKADPQGRLWAGTTSLEQKEKQAALFCFEPGAPARCVLSGLSLSNGLGWSPAGDAFFHIDTPTRRVTRYHFDPETGELKEPRLLIQFQDADGWPDGLACDAEGNLWIALFAGHGLVYVDGDSGQILQRVRLPVSNVTSCTHGGPDLRTLYCTTAWEGFTLAQREAEPLAGAIFALSVDTPGQPVSLHRSA